MTSSFLPLLPSLTDSSLCFLPHTASLRPARVLLLPKIGRRVPLWRERRPSFSLDCFAAAHLLLPSSRPTRLSALAGTSPHETPPSHSYQLPRSRVRSSQTDGRLLAARSNQGRARDVPRLGLRRLPLQVSLTSPMCGVDSELMPCRLLAVPESLPPLPPPSKPCSPASISATTVPSSLASTTSASSTPEPLLSPLGNLHPGTPTLRSTGQEGSITLRRERRQVRLSCLPLCYRHAHSLLSHSLAGFCYINDIVLAILELLRCVCSFLFPSTRTHAVLLSQTSPPSPLHRHRHPPR